MQRVKEVTLTHDKFVQSAELNGKAKNSLIFPSSSQTIPNTSNEDVTCWNEESHRAWLSSERRFSAAFPRVVPRSPAES